MKRSLQSLIILPISLIALSLTACSANQHAEQISFPYSGKTLSVINENGNMPVTVSASAPAGQVLVKVHTQTKGKRAGSPAWSLSDGVLNLGTPCNTGFVGYCEGRYSVEVPKETKVLVNGQPRAIE